MAIIRGKRETNFTILKNDPLRDTRLSFKARGIMSYMLSLPDDWKFYISELARHSDHDGRDSIQSGLKELEKCGYLQRITKRSSNGRFDSIDYLLVDTPVSSPETDIPDTGKPDSDNPQPVKPDTANPPLRSTNVTKDLSLPSTEGTNDDDGSNSQPGDPVKKSWVKLWDNDPNSVVSPKLREWSQSLSPELVCYAITVAGEYSVKQSGALKYLQRVIDGWQSRGITTLKQAKQAATDHDKRQAERSKLKGSRTMRKKRREVIPQWAKDEAAGKEFKPKNRLSEADRQKLQRQLASLDSD